MFKAFLSVFRDAAGDLVSLLTFLEKAGGMPLFFLRRVLFDTRVAQRCSLLFFVLVFGRRTGDLAAALFSAR